MAFRADEAAQRGLESAKNYLIPRDIKSSKSEDMLLEIVEEYGPVVGDYPSWHPMIARHKGTDPITRPSNERSPYKGLDHTCYFLNAFITCPYNDGQEVIDSVEALSQNPIATIRAERLDVQFYAEGTTPVLVTCDWNVLTSNNQMIPASVAVPLLLEKELPCHKWAQCAETWETMRPYFLGTPHGSRSSLFVDQQTALTMKKIWNLLIGTGMFGDIKIYS